MATPLPAALSRDGHAVVDLLRADGPQGEKAARAHAFIYGVGEHALAHHLREPLERLGVGRMMRQGLGVALDLALRGLRTPLRRILDGMDEDQLRGVADEIEVRLYPDPHG